MTLDVIRLRDKNTEHGMFRFAELGSGPAAHASWWSFDDEQEVRDRWWHPKAEDTVLDIGAAFGSYALPALVAGARVICFSPAPFDTELLRKNMSLNPESAKRCLVLRDALYSAHGYFQPDKALFKPYEAHDDPRTCDVCGDGQEDDGYSKLEYPNCCPSCGDRWLRAESDHVQWLRTEALDTVLRERPGIDHVKWMKLDVEGAELEVLKGARLTIEQDRPSIIVENHEFQIPGIGEQVKAYMLGLGLEYKCDGPVPHTAVSHSFFYVDR